LMNAKTML